MKTVVRIRSIVCVLIVGLVMGAFVPPSSSAAQRGARLSVSPGKYVGGQRLTFQGNIGHPGKRRIHLQTNMGRPGDRWTDLPGSGAMTKANGSFRFTHRAPSMFGIRLRVVGGRAATGGFLSTAKSQDLTIRSVNDVAGVGSGQALAGRPFWIKVDTTPTLAHRPDLPPPAFPGRKLTLQKRVRGSHWSSVATTKTTRSGNGTFKVKVSHTGTVVYRVRQENWTANGNQIGWFPSFPTYVKVLAKRPARSTAPTRSSTSGSTAAKPAPTAGTALSSGPAARASGPGGTASGTNRWGAARWDFAWEFGESLGSRPYRGTVRRGWWADTSNGSGRVAKYNGGLMFDSQRGQAGRGDHGTTSATLHGNALKYGRWETKVRLKSPERNARDYRVRVELVPERARDYHCGAQNITVADFAAHGRNLTVGAKARKNNRKWSYTRSLASLNGSSAAFAIEVKKGHLTWFVNGRSIATLKNPAAVSDVPMTMRLSLVGSGQREMNRTQAIFDWQRGFSADRGRSVVSGHSLRRTSHVAGC